MRLTRRVVLGGVVGLGVVVVAGSIALARVLPVVRVAVAYKAKMVCSGVFAASRTEAAVLEDLQRDDLAGLRYIRSRGDISDGSVTASALGIVRRKAVTRGATGCAIVPISMPGWRLRSASARDSVGIGARAEVASLPEAPADDPLRAALAPVLSHAFDEPDPKRPRRTQAVVILHQGRIVAERYAPGLGPETSLLGWSMTKSVMNALVGILVREGRLSLEAPVALPGVTSGTLTLNHLLHMESGLRFDEGNNGVRSDVVRMLFETGDMASFAASRGVDAAPGSRWRYASGTTLLIARIIRDALHDDHAYVAFPRKALFDRLGMRSAVMETDSAGTFVGSSLMYATARDWARFGQLYLDDGVWNGERILPEGWVDYTRSPAPADSTRGYGAHFWLGVPTDPTTPVTPLPAGALQAAGHEGQFITVLPSHDAVVVRLGRTRYADAWEHEGFIAEILALLPRRQP